MHPHLSPPPLSLCNVNQSDRSYQMSYIGREDFWGIRTKKSFSFQSKIRIHKYYFTHPSTHMGSVKPPPHQDRYSVNGTLVLKCLLNVTNKKTRVTKSFVDLCPHLHTSPRNLKKGFFLSISSSLSLKYLY